MGLWQYLPTYQVIILLLYNQREEEMLLAAVLFYIVHSLMAIFKTGVSHGRPLLFY